MLILVTMCVAGLLAAWLLLRTRDADRPRIPHYLALFFSMGVACISGYALLLHAFASGVGRHIDASLLWGPIIVIIAALLVAGVFLKNQAWRQVAGIAGSFLLGVILLTVCVLGLLLLALRGPQPPALSKLQSKFPQRRSQLELMAAVLAPPQVRPPKSIEEIQRERQLATTQPSPSLTKHFLNLFSHHDAIAPRVVFLQNEAILFIYGNQNGPLIGGGRGPSWGYLYCADPPDGNPAYICQDAAIHSGADWGPPTLLSLRLDQHWFAYSRGPSS